MGDADPSLRSISDTACWSAIYRARETERENPLFRDPFARRLAGERGEQIAAAMSFTDRSSWPWVARTYLYDRFISDQVRQSSDMVINLAAGLDTRPYRMALPASLRWVEVDLAETLAYKQQVLSSERPVCAVERVALDLSDESARRTLFARLGGQPRRALIVTEGFLIYFTAAQVAALARDLAAVPGFGNWVVDLASPGLLRILQKKMGDQLVRGGSAFHFAPPEGPGFFAAHGWRPIDVRSLLKTAATLKRLSLAMRLLALLPASNGAQGSRPWGGVCLLTKP